MLTKCKEEDFYQIESVGQDRMSPRNISGFSWAILFFSVITTIVSFGGLYPEDRKISTIIVLMILWSSVLLFIQFLLTLFFTSKKVAYKFQRFQSTFLSFIGFKFSFDTYQAFFGICERFNSPSYIRNTGMLLLAGGIIFLILSTMRAVKRVNHGKLRKGGKGLYDFKNSKGYISVPFIFGVTMLAGTAAKYISDMSTDITAFAALFFAVLLQYSMAMALPEFFLLTYCKFRFESFKVKMPK